MYYVVYNTPLYQYIDIVYKYTVYNILNSSISLIICVCVICIIKLLSYYYYLIIIFFPNERRDVHGPILVPT